MISPRRASLIVTLVLGTLLSLAPHAMTDPPGLAFSSSGQGEPTIVLIHGAGQDRHLWDRVTPLLESRHRVVRVDLPGHGESPPVTPFSVQAVASALDRTLDRQKIKKAVLVGHSYGAFVALEEAAAHPSRASAIVPIDLPSYIVADSERIGNLETLLRDRYPLFVAGVFQQMTRDSSQMDSVVAKAETVPREVLSAYFRESWTMDLRPRIKKLKQPIMVVLTDQTWSVAESWTSARARLGYETAGPAIGRRISASGHLIPLDQPDSLAAAILGFAATLRR
jgi:pimeloyl-ACP methyl ester carboxylesterase